MGLPAARVRDMTGHGTPLAPGPGCPTVLINKMPAWRVVMDTHACPLVTVLVPHLVGVVVMGSMRVRIGGLFAARQGDTVMEAGAGPNPIAAGEPTVLIG